ncbi:MAG TPA: hypothetical protein VF666_00640 [Pyrinomonadaceae bacterium]
MNKVIRTLTLTAIVATFALPAFAQTPAPTTAATPAATAGAPQVDEKAKADLYEKWRSNRKENQSVAYTAGKEYLQKYGTDNDAYVTAVKKFVDNYERAKRDFDFKKALEAKNYAEAFRLGREISSANPDRTDVKLLLGWTGYLATVDKNDAHISEATNYARQAVQDIENGRQPKGTDAAGAEIVSWAPFGSREDALGGLYFALGSFATKGDRSAEATQHFYKAAQLNGFTKKEPNTYANLAGAYELSEYRKYADDYRAMTTADASAAEKPEAKALLAKLDNVTDRIIDAYARAISLASDAKYASQKAFWMKKLTALYKFRNNDSEAGLNEFIAGIMNKPMPAPTPATDTAAPVAPSTGAGNGAGMGNGAGTGTGSGTTGPTTTTTGGAAMKPATPTGTTVTQTTTTVTSTTTPAKPMPASNAKPKP